MDFELRAAKEKLEREQKERKEKARIKIERERKAREEARRQQEALDAERQARRIEAIQTALAHWVYTRSNSHVGRRRTQKGKEGRRRSCRSSL